MKDESSYSVGQFLYGVVFAAFIAIKVAGAALAAWSWWWLLFPLVPVMALVLGKMGWL
jgi:hypothetical protein